MQIAVYEGAAPQQERGWEQKEERSGTGKCWLRPMIIAI